MTSVTIDSNRVSTYDAIRWASNEFGSNFKIHNVFPVCYWRFDFESKLPRPTPRCVDDSVV